MATKNQWDTITHFTPDEFDHPDLISYRLLLQLDSLRSIIKFPLHISSDIRQTSSTSTHAYGNAVDLVCRNTTTRYEIVQAALRVGFLRIGVYDRHIHLDIGAPDKITPALWTGISK